MVTSIIKKIWESKNNGDSYVELWGDGTPTRDFLYVDDAINGLILSAEKYDKTETLKLRSGVEITIEKLAKIIMKIMNVELEIKWNTNMPNGPPRRCVSFEKASNDIGFSPKTTLEVGLEKTIKWFEEKQVKIS